MSTHPCPIEELLWNNGLRRTKDRQFMIAKLRLNRTWTLTQMDNVLPQTSQTTVYRNLKKFLDLDLIEEAFVHNHETHFEWMDREHHDHVICKKCSIAECIPCPSPDLNKHRIELEHICLLCNND
ncbi:MAG: transcriptional repressor [Candidatus Uhrbacteria bacterium]|nr:transcriptional repressor [Candidatus Uhrbacteria bacterium]